MPVPNDNGPDREKGAALPELEESLDRILAAEQIELTDHARQYVEGYLRRGASAGGTTRWLWSARTYPNPF